MDKTTILSVLASLGVVGTAVATATAVPKAQKRIADTEYKINKKLTTKEKIDVVWDCYIPPVLVGAGTIACILGANALNKQRQAELISAYGVVEQCYMNYRRSLVELHGEEADEEVLEHMKTCREYAEWHQYGLTTPDQYTRWYEPLSDQWFNAYEREVMDAEYHINRNYALMCELTLNDILHMLNLPDIGEYGDDLVYGMDEGFQWIDFEHEEKQDADGVYYIIRILNPYEDYKEIRDECTKRGKKCSECKEHCGGYR